MSEIDRGVFGCPTPNAAGEMAPYRLTHDAGRPQQVIESSGNLFERIASSADRYESV